MEAHQQLLAGVILAILLMTTGILRAHRRGTLFTTQGKVDFGYILKLIPLSIAFAAIIVSTALTVVFFSTWALHSDQPGSQPLPLDAFMPTGYAPHYAMALGALVTFALSCISYVDHVNTGTSTVASDSIDARQDEEGADAR